RIGEAHGWNRAAATVEVAEKDASLFSVGIGQSLLVFGNGSNAIEKSAPTGGPKSHVCGACEGLFCFRRVLEIRERESIDAESGGDNRGVRARGGDEGGQFARGVGQRAALSNGAVGLRIFCGGAFGDDVGP